MTSGSSSSNIIDFVYLSLYIYITNSRRKREKEVKGFKILRYTYQEFLYVEVE